MKMRWDMRILLAWAILRGAFAETVPTKHGGYAVVILRSREKV
jgi:hypothetical protein